MGIVSRQSVEMQPRARQKVPELAVRLAGLGK